MNKRTRCLVASSHGPLATAAIVLLTSSGVGTVTSGILNRILYCGYSRESGFGFSLINFSTNDHAKNWAIKVQWIFRLLLSPFWYGRELRKSISKLVLISFRNAISCSLHHVVSLPETSVARSLFVPLSLRNFSHFATASATVIIGVAAEISPRSS